MLVSELNKQESNQLHRWGFVYVRIHHKFLYIAHLQIGAEFERAESKDCNLRPTPSSIQSDRGAEFHQMKVHSGCIR
jgi:ribosomal protein L14E/L6E/L27E